MIKIANKFKPLFELFNGNYPNVDTVIITGGRYSAKSYTVGLAITESMIQKDFNILYTRFTNQSIKDSVSKEITNSIDLLGYTNDCVIQLDRVISNYGEGNIVFKGIKTGSGNQTANLKSLSGFNVFVVDEAEEIPNFETFKKVYYSIRSVDRQNISILILNPSLKSHWIYKELFEKKEVKGGYNGVKDNIMYIHVSYLDLDQKIIPKNILNDFESLKISDPHQYNNIVLGGWIDRLEGALYNELNYFSELEIKAESKFCYIDPAFEGNDYCVAILGEMIGNSIYITDLICDDSGIDITLDRLSIFLNKHKPTYTWIESNGGGQMFFNSLQKLTKNILIPIYSSMNKHTRILNSKGFVDAYVKFKKTNDKEYNEAINQIIAYNRDDKLNKGMHDDAPDCLSGLCKVIHTNYIHLF